MLARPPAADPDAKRERKRERARERQREKREREENGIVTFPGRASSAVIDAIIARNCFLGMSREEAERQARDPKKISAEAFDILEGWAPNWRVRK